MTAEARLRENALSVGPKIVTSGHALATAAGATLYAKGGNAFDAALAACFMEHIALPMKCGLAGDFVALHRRDGGPFQTIISIGAGALALDEGARMENVGPCSVGIPGAPHGYASLHAFCKAPLPDLIQPAVRASTEGVPWTRVALSYVEEGAALLARYSPDNPYTPDGRIPGIGETRKLPALGDLLRRFAVEGEALFEGDIGAEIVDRLAGLGGFLTRQDFSQRPAQHAASVCEEIAPGIRLSVTPPPTHGAQLAAIARAELSRGGDLLSIVREARLVAKRAGREPADGGTSVVTAADDEGNAVVVLHSNSFPQFASGIVLPSGLILNNRPGRGFDLEAPETAANAPKAGRVPWTTLHAWCLETAERTVIGATPGGVNQLPWNAQSVTALARGATIAETVTAPRWSLDARNAVGAEPGVPLVASPDKNLESFSLRSAQQMIELGGPIHLAACDPRAGATGIGLY